MTRVRADNTLRRRVAAAALVTALVVLLGASAGAARVRPKCFGKPATIVGSNGSDRISGAHGDDLIVGDDYSEVSADGRTGRDHLLGGFDRDFIVGDNLSRGDVKGSSPDWIGGNAGGDTVIGDSASFKGDATGG